MKVAITLAPTKWNSRHPMAAIVRGMSAMGQSATCAVHALMSEDRSESDIELRLGKADSDRPLLTNLDL